MLFRFESEIPPVVQMRLKVEINCYEHFNVLGLTKIPFTVDNPWFTGSAELTTYKFEELLGTKLRALYQRTKGRDLFDLYCALTKREVDVQKVMLCYRKYMEFVVGKAPSYKQFVANMEEKMLDTEFLEDTEALLRPDTHFISEEAYPLIYDSFIDKMEGRRD
jgi:predicted nucleotidyltransferase component of viral defense system